MGTRRSAHDVAAYLVDDLGPLSTMQLHKLLYYSQAWHLAWAEAPLFAEPIEAWAPGPVVRELFEAHRGRFTVHHWPAGDPTTLTDDERGTLDAVIAGYGPLSGRQLSALIHSERPWRAARGDLHPTDRRSPPIDLDDMCDFYTALDCDTTATPIEALAWPEDLHHTHQPRTE